MGKPCYILYIDTHYGNSIQVPYQKPSLGRGVGVGPLSQSLCSLGIGAKGLGLGRVGLQFLGFLLFVSISGYLDSLDPRVRAGEGGTQVIGDDTSFASPKRKVFGLQSPKSRIIDM